MGKCPKCDKTYDDTWKVCLNCEVNLIDVMPSQNTPKSKFNKEFYEKKKELVEKLRKQYKKYIISVWMQFLMVAAIIIVFVAIKNRELAFASAGVLMAIFCIRGFLGFSLLSKVNILIEQITEESQESIFPRVWLNITAMPMIQKICEKAKKIIKESDFYIQNNTLHQK